MAVLDGLPLENHTGLAGRIIVDDPDDDRSRYQVSQQQHGTAMASLVIHGDLNDDGPVLQQQVYVRPIFVPDSFQGTTEITPPDRLLADLLDRAVRRLFDGDGDQPPASPTVQIISLSLEDRDQPFDLKASPLARLIDWLAWKYKVLIIVSISNRDLPVTLDSNWRNLSDDDLVSVALRVMQRERYQRRPLSPAEAINCFLLVRYTLTRAPLTRPAPGL